MRPKKIFEGLIFLFIVGALLFLGYIQGLAELSIFGRQMVEAEFSLIGFTAFLAISAVLYFGSLMKREYEQDFDEPVAALVPTYHDAHVLSTSVESLVNSRYDNLNIKIISEPGDVEGVAKAEELAEQYENVVSIVNESDDTSKAGAMNYVIENSEEDVFAIFDADQEVDTDFIPLTTGYLKNNDIVQGRFIPETDGAIESLSYYEYALFGHCFRQIVFLLTRFRMAASKSIVLTREAWEKAGGYNEDVVTEDYDFAHRCYRNGLDVKMVHTEITKEEAVHSFKDWWGQRKRWMTGNVQVLHVLLGKLKEEPRNHRVYISALLSLASIGGSMFLVGLLPKFWLAAQNGAYVLAALPVIALYAAALPSRIIDYRNGKAKLPGWETLLIPLTLPLFSLITIKATIEYFISWDGEWFSVDK